MTFEKKLIGCEFEEPMRIFCKVIFRGLFLGYCYFWKFWLDLQIHVQSKFLEGHVQRFGSYCSFIWDVSNSYTTCRLIWCTSFVESLSLHWRIEVIPFWGTLPVSNPGINENSTCHKFWHVEFLLMPKTLISCIPLPWASLPFRQKSNITAWGYQSIRGEIIFAANVVVST